MVALIAALLNIVPSAAHAQNTIISQPTTIRNGLSAPHVIVASTLTLESGVLSCETLTVVPDAKVVFIGGAVRINTLEVAQGGKIEFFHAVPFAVNRTILAGTLDLGNAFSIHTRWQPKELLPDASGKYGTIRLRNNALPSFDSPWNGEVCFYGGEPIVLHTPAKFRHLTLDGVSVHFDRVEIEGILHLSGGDLYVVNHLSLNGGILRQGDEKISVVGKHAEVAVGGLRGASIVTDLPKRGGTAL
ncbi:MAG: hypothetical protein RMM53_00035, partial [Bacteroidia bacterium]|nr:hypothetical protein [Bacteroidia bacterium]MDW8332583.1 hypothetical protein [Bacteroidia bacterium]